MMFAALMLSASLAAAGEPELSPYQPFLRSGCIDGPPVPLQSADQAPAADPQSSLMSMPLSARSLRFFITPDSFRGEGMLMLQIDSGLRRDLGADGQPFVSATVGTWQRSCTVRMPLSDCPQATAVLQRLKQLQVLVGHGFDEPQAITLHATTYALQFNGDRLNQLIYSQPGNPLERPLEEAKMALSACWAPAAEAVSAKGPD